ncbi:hypothetical protein M3Y97_00839500 [Aphelenchoides bicaudatus]|nr:hypothetical protein M3Y97_00839500 [Aphelenchoides bicaudatus]
MAANVEPNNLEQNLKTAVEKTLSASNEIQGLVVCNQNGYLLSKSGTLNEDSAAVISHLSMLVGQLENEDPVIQLEGKDSRVLIHKRDDLIVALHKTIPEPTTGD